MQVLVSCWELLRKGSIYRFASMPVEEKVKSVIISAQKEHLSKDDVTHLLGLGSDKKVHTG